MRPAAPPMPLTDSQREILESLSRSPGAPHREVQRARALLLAAIEAYLQANNADPRPFIWTASAEAILAKVRRGRVALAQIPG